MINTLMKHQIRIYLMGYNTPALHKVAGDMAEVLQKVPCKSSGIIVLPTYRKLISTPRSPFIYSAHQNQYEYKKCKLMLEIFYDDKKVIQAISQLTIPHDVEIFFKEKKAKKIAKQV